MKTHPHEKFFRHPVFPAAGKQQIFFKTLSIILVLIMVVPLFARVRPTSGFNMFSAQDEIQEGQKASADVGKQLPLLPDSDPVTQYVQKLGANLASHAP